LMQEIRAVGLAQFNCDTIVERHSIGRDWVPSGGR